MTMKTNSPKTDRKIWLAAAVGWALLILFTQAQTVSAQQWTGPDGNNNISNTNTGNVGVGLTTPLYKFDVLSGTNIMARFGSTAAAHSQVLFDAPSGYNSNLTLQNGGVSKWYLGNRAVNNRFSLIESTGNIEVFSILQNGNVGIGTTSPLGTLHTKGQYVFFDDSAGNISGGIYANTLASNPFSIWSGEGNFRIGTGVTNRMSGAGFVERITILNSNGNVGIGTTTPDAKLEVVGNIHVTGTGNLTAAGTIEGGNIKAKYQDVAEWVESSQELPAGTLVVLDHTKSNQVIASSQAYDTRVAGVISERPGIALGEGGDNKVLVATTGRVMLTVDASKGPIQIGDLLVTSDIRGVAMKSQAINVAGVQIHRPGTLIGKALEPLENGSGKILVLLSLQ
jgi:hypothetical protein